ncbi:methyltransferase [Methyloceanibacter sp. wino2]|uniref:methyltransferase n=1 Tax=Methyloceanibacter sp. wino2 TaxID=2170729 RepID=UPI00131ED771|nr:methyltransferase [Methyloceanibacter sp. wino2]
MDETEQREIEERLKDRIAAYHEAALLFTAVTAGLPDLLKAEPRNPEALASDLGLEAGPLRRLLRGLVAMRLCEELDDGRFALTPAAECLTHGSPSNLSEKAFVVVGQYWMPWMSMMYSLRTGEPSLPFALNKTAADWRGAKSDEGRFLFRYVAKEELANPGSMHEALGDVAEGAVIASVGGGYGAWLADVLERDPSLKGIVYDAPPVLDDAMRLFDVLGFADRIEFLPGDAREEVPAVADIYVLKSVLQRHDDTDAAAVLENCRRAMTPGARLVIYERLMPEDASADPEAIMTDLHMMAITGGKTRTLAEMEALIAGAGLSGAGHRKTADGMTAIDVRTP